MTTRKNLTGQSGLMKEAWEKEDKRYERQDLVRTRAFDVEGKPESRQ